MIKPICKHKMDLSGAKVKKRDNQSVYIKMFAVTTATGYAENINKRGMENECKSQE